ncbi:hypothetical protein UB40_02470 [Photobacterium kishitanii]|nr:hypothetical protein UB40_02470 [Photobacterium kishitanii]
MLSTDAYFIQQALFFFNFLLTITFLSPNIAGEMSSDEDSRRAANDEYHNGIKRRPAEEVSEKRYDPIMF